MRLLQLIKPIHSFRCARAIADFHVRGLCCNSRSVRPGYVFVAVKGAAQDGRRFIGEAVARGARAVISAPGSSLGSGVRDVSLIEVSDTRRVLSLLANEFNRRPSTRMKVTGVTGTNGKTTITYLIETIIRKAGFSPAVIGTVNYRYGGKAFPSCNTTPGPVELHGLLGRMVRAGATHAVMEVSSHALDQNRTRDVAFSSAIFTNLTQDHLDYHKDFAGYFAAKARLFTGLSPTAAAIVNEDDRYGRRLKKMTRARLITYGISRPCDVRAQKIKMDVRGCSFLLNAFGKKTRITTSLIGRHNVYNLLAACAWAVSEGIPLKTVREAIRGFSLVPGRLEKVECAEGFSVFVDYAHTEDALRNVITSLRQVSRGRIIVVFGCGGDRDRTKRPRMGRVVSRLADLCVVTSDNPRSEDPLAIIREVTGGIRGKRHLVVADRKEAIGKALSAAKRGDIVLIAGKGHENYQIIGGLTLPFDDRSVVKECLRYKR
ncbi:MAG: UDP-N-acetylmuramoyl-L-alanyl-D-glutamate--2,6-diaminopimelate ligase [Deltaproteobacteria bacterium]